MKRHSCVRKKKERRKTVGTYVCARMFACVTDKKNVADKNVSQSFLFVLFFLLLFCVSQKVTARVARKE